MLAEPEFRYLARTQPNSEIDRCFASGKFLPSQFSPHYEGDHCWQSSKEMSNHANSGTSLESMPVDVLGRMGEMIGGWSTFQLATLSGSRSLHAKFHSPHCLRTLAFDFCQPWNAVHRHNTAIVESSLAKFPGLNCLDIRQLGEPKFPFYLKTISSIPPTITSLTLGLHSAMDAFFETPTFRPTDSLEILDISTILPNLLDLRVTTDGWASYRSNSTIVATKFLSALPRHLEHITIRMESYSVDSSILALTRHWPESIKTIDIFGASLADFAPELVLPGLTTFSVYGDDTKIPFQPAQAPNLTALNFFSLSPIFDVLEQFPQVTSVSTTGNFEMNATTELRPTIKRMSLSMPRSKLWIPVLPRGLTHLDAQLSTASCEHFTKFSHSLPPNLLHLTLVFETAVKITSFSHLPRTLEHLELDGITYLRPEEHLKGLPRLQTLSLQASGKSLPFSVAFVKHCLPRSLTSLTLGPRCDFWLGEKGTSIESMKDFDRFKIEEFPRLFAVSFANGRLSDVDLLQIPKQISLFGSGTISFQGHLIDRNAKSFSSHNISPSLSRQLPDSVRLHSVPRIDKGSSSVPQIYPLAVDPIRSTQQMSSASVGPTINLQPVNPLGYSSSLEHLEYHLTTPLLHQIVWFTPALTSLKAPLVFEAHHEGLPATLTSIDVNKMELSAVARVFPRLRILKATFTTYGEGSVLPDTLEQLSAAMVHPSCCKGLKALRKLKFYNSNSFTDSDLALLPRSITSFKLRRKLDRAGGGYGWYARKDNVHLTEAAVLPFNLTVFDAPTVKMKISKACYLPPSLTKLIIEGATADFKEFEIINLDLESVSDLTEAPIKAAGSQQLVTLEGRQKAQQTLAKATSRTFLQSLLEAYLALHRPQVQLLPTTVGSEYVDVYQERRPGPMIEGTAEVEPAQFAAKLARNLKSFSFAFRDMKPAKTLKVRRMQECHTEVSILGSRFTKALPPHLTNLSISNRSQAAGLHMSKFLPSTLTHLSVNARLWNRVSLSQLPAGLQSLELWFIRKWNVRYTESLGHLKDLISLRIDTHSLCDQDVKNLPPSLKRLTLRSNSLTTGFLAILPPQLESLTFSSFTLSNESVVGFLSSHAAASIPSTLRELYRVRPSYRGEETESLSALLSITHEERALLGRETALALVADEGYDEVRYGMGRDEEDYVPF